MGQLLPFRRKTRKPKPASRETINWLRWQLEIERNRQWFAEHPEIDQIPHLQNLPFELFQKPGFLRRAEEVRYRKGFFEGVKFALKLMRHLHSIGYSRSPEIANIIEGWASGKLKEWQLDAQNAATLYQKPPSLECLSWQKVRREALERDGNRCVMCGSIENLEAHHIHPVSEGGVAQIDNLKTLCKRCHR